MNVSQRWEQIITIIIILITCAATLSDRIRHVATRHRRIHLYANNNGWFVNSTDIRLMDFKVGFCDRRTPPILTQFTRRFKKNL